MHADERRLAQQGGLHGIGSGGDIVRRFGIRRDVLAGQGLLGGAEIWQLLLKMPFDRRDQERGVTSDLSGSKIRPSG